MTKYYDEDGITIYHGDAREVLPTLAGFDLLLTDPPLPLTACASTCSIFRLRNTPL